MANQISRRPEQEIRFFPVVDTRASTVLRYTVLLPAGGLASEEAGSSQWRRDLAMVEATLKLLAERQRTGQIQMVGLSLPIHPAPLRDSEFIDALRQFLDDFALSTVVLSVDLIEPPTLDLSELDAFLAPLKALGINVGLDNYLPDSMSIPALVAANVDCLMLHEQGLVHLLNNATICRFLQGMTQLCEVLSKTMVVKGVNSAAQRELLESMGLYYMQGRYFSEPLLATELVLFEAEMAKRR
ncbi:EAL domain-containing protein [Halomonas sp. TRM85114]|uniref:EAL domain-containing protein n=1 Tax=Halomonas jincaotanensis TaxID=2810616 RepID=UPI001BD30C6E|nr:EAL domain-containing protein [Halomonas jincaotanensis]MBS9404599.1 EAL domain-containing protein [Halomonas jincaotanensis]